MIGSLKGVKVSPAIGKQQHMGVSIESISVSGVVVSNRAEQEEGLPCSSTVSSQPVRKAGPHGVSTPQIVIIN